MSTNSYSIDYKPVRIGFLVRENNFEDLIKAVEINTILWGGIYNPIIPVSTNTEYVDELIEMYEVDVIYSSVDNNEEINKVFHRYPYLADPNHYGKKIYYEDEKEFGYIDIDSVIDEYINGKQKGLTFIDLRWSKEDKLNNLFKICFGEIPSIIGCSSNFNNSFQKLKPKKIEIDEGSIIDAKILEYITPIFLSTININTLGSIKEHYRLLYSSGGIFFGNSDNYCDYIYYWNLRLAGHRIIFIALDYIDRFKSFFTFIQNFQVINNTISVYYRESNESIVHLIIQEQLKKHTLSYTLDESYEGLVRFNKLLSIRYKKSTKAIGHIDKINGNTAITLDLSEKPFDNIIDKKTNFQNLCIILKRQYEYGYDDSTLTLPVIPKLNSTFSLLVTHPTGAGHPYSIRNVKDGICYLIRKDKRSITLFPIQYEKIIFEIFKHIGFNPEYSLAGHLTKRIISKLGSIEDCRLFKITSLRKLIKKTKVEEAKTESAITGFLFDDGDFKRFEYLFIEKRNKSTLNTSDVFKFLLKHNFFRAGLELKCNTCLLDNWLSLKNIDDYWTCEYCGNQNMTSIELSRQGNWKYRKSGLLGKDNNQEGAIPVILTLLLLKNCIGDIHTHNMIYSTSINLKGMEDCEIDLCVINANSTNFEIAIGECKDSGGEIDENDINNLKKIRQKLVDNKIYPCYFIFSKTSESFTQNEINLFKKLEEEHIQLILLTNRDLEWIYFLYDGYKDQGVLKNKSIFSLSDLSDNSHTIYLKENNN